eukprot:g69102.t1
MSAKSGPTCPRKHGLSSFQIPSSGSSCESCGTKHSEGATMHGCRAFDYDLCQSCYNFLTLMQQAQGLVRPSKRQKQRHESDQHKALVPATSVLAGLSSDLWRLVCSFVADDPLWLFKTWARVCKRANGPTARPAAPPFALDLRKIRGPIPTTVWQEWKELTCVTFKDTTAVSRIGVFKAQARTRQPVFTALAVNRIRVHALSFPATMDLDLAGAAGINVLGRIEQERLRFGWICGPPETASFITDAGLLHLSGLQSLQHLELKFCRKITDAGLVHLAGLHRLERLHITRCVKLIGAGLVHLSGLHRLKYLDLRGCEKLTDAGLVHLACLHRLQYLNLNRCNRLTNVGLVHLSGLHSLRQLNLNGCQQLTDAGLVHLSVLHQLEHLGLGYCRGLTGAGLVDLSGLDSLRHLCLKHCEQLTDAGLVGLHRLEHLDLSHCKRLTDVGLVGLSDLHQLKHLDLGHCEQLTDAGLAHLSGLHSLQHLDLGHCNRFTDAGLVHISAFIGFWN